MRLSRCTCRWRACRRCRRKRELAPGEDLGCGFQGAHAGSVLPGDAVENAGVGPGHPGEPGGARCACHSAQIKTGVRSPTFVIRAIIAREHTISAVIFREMETFAIRGNFFVLLGRLGLPDFSRAMIFCRAIFLSSLLVWYSFTLFPCSPCVLVLYHLFDPERDPHDSMRRGACLCCTTF